MTYTVHHGDCLVALRMMADDSIDAIVTDPPAGVAFMGKKWDTDKGGRDQWIAWMQEIADECKRVLKPGAHALVWSLPRTSHWTATAWENAGLEVRDKIAHVFGSGFPKSHNLDGDWDGWGTALKPAREDWLMLRKPLTGTVAANVLAWGTGAINVDGCRVNPGETVQGGGNGKANNGGRFGAHETNGTRPLVQPHDAGRWPANFIHDGSNEVVGLFPENTGANGAKDDRGRTHVAFSMDRPRKETRKDNWGAPRDELGSAARFFYCAKASKAERDAGLDGLPVDVVRVTNTGHSGNPSAKNGERTFIPRANHHPTVKPVALMRYLCRLITPPGGTVLDPFCGSGTTGIGATLEGFNFVGIEQDAEYVEIAKLRISNAVAEQAFGLFDLENEASND